MTSERWARWIALCAAALAIATLPGCGGSNTIDPPTPPPSPTPWPPLVVTHTNGAALPAEYMGRDVFTTQRAGSLAVTIDWTYPANDIDALIVTGDCSYEQLDAEQCPIIGMAVSETAKPERIDVATAPAGTYTLFIGNLGPGDESISYQVVLTSSATTASSRVQALPHRWKRPMGGQVELP